MTAPSSSSFGSHSAQRYRPLKSRSSQLLSFASIAAAEQPTQSPWRRAVEHSTSRKSRYVTSAQRGPPSALYTRSKRCVLLSAVARAARRAVHHARASLRRAPSRSTACPRRSRCRTRARRRAAARRRPRRRSARPGSARHLRAKTSQGRVIRSEGCEGFELANEAVKGWCLLCAATARALDTVLIEPWATALRAHAPTAARSRGTCRARRATDRAPAPSNETVTSGNLRGAVDLHRA